MINKIVFGVVVPILSYVMAVLMAILLLSIPGVSNIYDFVFMALVWILFITSIGMSFSPVAVFCWDENFCR